MKILKEAQPPNFKYLFVSENWTVQDILNRLHIFTSVRCMFEIEYVALCPDKIINNSPATLAAREVVNAVLCAPQ